jgi:hypothetical protein
MWFVDAPGYDPDTNYPKPTGKQLLYAAKARRQLALFKRTLERLTVPQQREILSKVREDLVGGVFRLSPLRIEPGRSKVLELAEERRKRSTG